MVRKGTGALPRSDRDRNRALQRLSSFPHSWLLPGLCLQVLPLRPHSFYRSVGTETTTLIAVDEVSGLALHRRSICNLKTTRRRCCHTGDVSGLLNGQFFCRYETPGLNSVKIDSRGVFSRIPFNFVNPRPDFTVDHRFKQPAGKAVMITSSSPWETVCS